MLGLEGWEAGEIGEGFQKVKRRKIWYVIEQQQQKKQTKKEIVWLKKKYLKCLSPESLIEGSYISWFDYYLINYNAIPTLSIALYPGLAMSFCS